MDWIYPISYLTSLSGLVLWFVTYGNKAVSRKMSAVFLCAFLVYLAALSFSSGTLSYKLLILFRDVIVMGILSYAFNRLKENVALSLGLGAVAVVIVYVSYFQTLSFTFPQLDTQSLYADGEFLIHIRGDKTATLESLKSQFDCTISQAFTPRYHEDTDLDDYFVVDITGTRKRVMRRFYSLLRRHKNIAWIEPNEEMHLNLPDAQTPERATGRSFFANDPEISRQWGFSPLDTDRLHRMISSSGLRPQKTAHLVILDTGVDAVHEDLRGNYRGIQIDYDSDPNGHGTHCAGVAAAVSNNGIGIASLIPTSGFVNVSSVRVLNAQGMGTQKAIIDGMIQAVDMGADVISVSLGGFSTQSKQKAYRDAVLYAEKRGAIIVVAAGNNGRNAKSNAPANVEGVITVSAVDEQLRKAQFSNTVEDLQMGISAPGVNIFSTLPGDRYGAMSGTSMATPHVAGLVALMKSFSPKLSTRDAYKILKDTGKQLRDGKRTGNLIQPLGAIEAVVD